MLLRIKIWALTTSQHLLERCYEYNQCHTTDPTSRPFNPLTSIIMTKQHNNTEFTYFI